MALPKEPRQKMINIMYLVLTAILALNISAEILNAFKTVERSLATTNLTINESTDNILKSFEEIKKQDPSKAEKANFWEPRALKVQQLTNDMNKYIEDIKARILKEADFDPAKKGDSTFKEENQDIATRIMVEQGEGKKLYEKLKKYKEEVLKIAPELSAAVSSYLKQVNLEMPPTKNKSNNTWEAVYFRMVPTVAATTMLTKFQNDIKTAENRTISRYYQMVGEVIVRFNQFATIKGQNSTYLMPGQELQINAGVGAFSVDAKPTITIGGQVIQVNDKGIAEWKRQVTGLGTQTIPIRYEWTDQEGKRQVYEDKISYEVGQSSTAISLPEMNVLYIGYPNKVTVSGGGVGAEKISINATGGGANVRKTANGEFIVNVSQQTDNLVIAAFAEGKQIGALTYRVRLMPNASASVGGKKSGDNVNAATLAAQPGVGAGIENFPLPLKYTVTRFQVVGTDADGNLIRENCNGNSFTPRAKQIIRDSRSGDIITIEEIYCQGPDGSVKKLPSLLYNIN